jgi:membrane protein
VKRTERHAQSGLATILKRSLQQFKHDEVSDRAAALTYFGLLAIFPAALALVSVMGLLGKTTTHKILDNLGQAAPDGVSSVLHTLVAQVQGKAGAAGIAAILGPVLALCGPPRDVDEGRPIWKTAPTRLVTTLALVIMLVISAVIVIATGPVATQIGKAFGIGTTLVTVSSIAKWPVLLIIVSLTFSLLSTVSLNVQTAQIPLDHPSVA